MATDHRFIAHRRDEWYAVARADRLRDRPRAAMLFGTPIVVFRVAGDVAALVDRCPHRNVPLSLGRVRGANLQCAYHGWEFGRDGQCRAIPGLVGEVRAHERRATSFACREAHGFVWVWGEPEAPPSREPFRFPHLDERGWTTAREELEVRASLHATAENALDVPHTAFLHGGLFRSETRARREIEVIVRRFEDRVEAEYVGESRPPGLVAKLLAPRGGDVVHFDRFLLPSVAQVEYRLGDSGLCISAALTPLEDYRTKLFIAFSYRLPDSGLDGATDPALLRDAHLSPGRFDARATNRDDRALRGRELQVHRDRRALGGNFRTAPPRSNRGRDRFRARYSHERVTAGAFP